MNCHSQLLRGLHIKADIRNPLRCLLDFDSVKTCKKAQCSLSLLCTVLFLLFSVVFLSCFIFSSAFSQTFYFSGKADIRSLFTTFVQMNIHRISIPPLICVCLL